MTGTASPLGFGHAIAVEYARNNADHVYLVDIAADQSETEKAVGDAGATPVVLQVDLKDEEAVVAMFERIATDHSDRLATLVNNAGLVDARRPGPEPRTNWIDGTAAEIRMMFNVNVIGPMICVREAVPLFVNNGSGAIVNISSIGGRFGSKGCPIEYSSSKSALIGASRVWAHQLAPINVRSNTICPGPGNTEMWPKLPEEVRQKLLAATPIGRPVEPEELARSAFYYGSDNSGTSTGAVEDKNGGLWFCP